MLQEVQDLRAEADELHGFLATLGEDDWGRPTAFKGWTAWDVVAHLHFYDQVSLLALGDEEIFANRRRELIATFGKGTSNAELARQDYGEWSAAELLERWIGGCRDMARQLGESDPKRRLPWFGPDMGVRMFTTARLMETWAHGQEVYDQRLSPYPNLSRRALSQDTLIIEVKGEVEAWERVKAVVSELPMAITRNSKYALGFEAITGF